MGLYLSQCSEFSHKTEVQSQDPGSYWFPMKKFTYRGLTESCFPEPFSSAITTWLIFHPQYPTWLTVHLPICSINEMEMLEIKWTNNWS